MAVQANSRQTNRILPATTLLSKIKLTDNLFGRLMSNIIDSNRVYADLGPRLKITELTDNVNGLKDHLVQAGLTHSLLGPLVVEKMFK